ncbi:MAG: class B sortase [Bacilli bacterium]|nr:class B sortase [Bacilli bacterium]
MFSILGKKVLKILGVLLFASNSLMITTGDFESGFDPSTLNRSFIGMADIKPIAQEQKEVKEEVKVERINNVVSTPVIESNSINIDGILNKSLMKDTTGENFYLNHGINGAYDGIGVPYIDFRTNFNTRKTIAYAHSNMSGNGPFQVLQNYHNNKAFYDAHRYITINFDGKKYTYLIFSVYVSVADSPESEGLDYFYDMNYSDNEWDATIKKYKTNSDYDTGVTVNGNDKILILQTCSMDPNYREKYYRYNLLVMGKLV